jgi:hypothetical protein
LTRIESEAFYESSLQSILISSTILFIASDVVDIASQIKPIEENFCPEFDRWLELKRSGIAIDFRRIQRVGFDVPCLGDYTTQIFQDLDVTVFGALKPHTRYELPFENEKATVKAGLPYLRGTIKTVPKHVMQNNIAGR